MILINLQKYLPDTYHDQRGLVNTILNEDFIYLFIYLLILKIKHINLKKFHKAKVFGNDVLATAIWD